ncbi:flagellar biosynthesis protein FlgL [Pseudorhodoplanes sp.]|uniref:flagellin N-terminal helical domain-containing protein n=1 Tax=Pseudorhodoplanes sp. TaxID=1934341 RepID=UPI00391CC792
MSIANLGVRSLLLTQSLVGMRAQLGDMQRQLATGKRADDYAGLGIDRGLTVGLRAQLSAIGSYQDTVKSVGVRLELAQTALSRIADIGRETKALAAQMASPEGRVTAQTLAMSSLGEILGLLNTRAGDRYLFAGVSNDGPAVETLANILDGDGTRAGLRQVMAERRQADLGAGGLGRLTVSQPSPTSVAIAEEATVFGLKLTAISSTFNGATVAGPAGAPPEMSVDLGATNPAAGETLRLSFTLPDGSIEAITLTASASANPAAGEFTIGADPATTAANLQAAVSGAIGHLARTALTAASALAASDNFFNIDAGRPPQRVDGPPFDTATGLIDGTAADTVSWYIGDMSAQPVRSTATARVDQSITVQYGMQANEEGIRWQLQHVAALAAMPLPEGDPDIDGRAGALAERLRVGLGVPPGIQTVETIQSELAGAQTTLKASEGRHRQANATLANLLEDIEGVSNEEVAAKILAMQTNLQASLQVTARLFQTSILNYL